MADWGLGSVLAGKYRVDRVIGEGGMGVVVAATHLQLDQPVAIKLVRPETLGRPEIVGRLVREARASARLRSEHVVRVLDVGQLADGTPFIVMEFLEGMDLARLIELQGPLQPAVAIDYVLQACDAIAEAHANGIVHRDLKPANLFLTSTAHGKKAIKVLDFGIAKSSRPGELTLTGAATVMGSPQYMSPEQLRSAHTVDGRSDIWSLGVILWQLITGKMPFDADTFTELCIRIAVDPLPAMPKVPGGHSALEAVLRRALEKDPRERFGTVIELAQALAPYTYPSARVVAERLRSHGAAPAESVDETLDAALGQRGYATVNQLPRSPLRKKVVGGALVATVIAAVSAIAMVAATSKTSVPAAAVQPTVTPLPPEAPPPAPVVVPPPVVTAATPDAGAAAAVADPPTVVEPPPVVKPKPKPKPRPRPAAEEVDPFKSAY